MSNLISQGNMFGSINTQTQQNYLTAGGGTFSLVLPGSNSVPLKTNKGCIDVERPSWTNRTTRCQRTTRYCGWPRRSRTNRTICWSTRSTGSTRRSWARFNYTRTRWSCWARGTSWTHRSHGPSGTNGGQWSTRPIRPGRA